MAKCKETHDFDNWSILEYTLKNGYVKVEDIDGYIEKQKKKHEEYVEKHKANIALFNFYDKILWQRKCKTCGKLEKDYLSIFGDKPKNTKVKVEKKKKSSYIKPKKKVDDVNKKDKSMSKGWKDN
jgi:hypothetical protein